MIYPITVAAGVLQVDNFDDEPITLDGGLLQGSGTVQDVTSTANGGAIAPGSTAPGILNTGTVTSNNASALDIQIDGTTAGADYDQLDVTGNVLLDGAVLNVTLGFIPGPNGTYTIINNDSTDPVTGEFAGHPQGSVFSVPNGMGGGSTQFRINYFGGDGNDVTLTTNAAPVAADDFYSLPESSTTDPSFFVPPPGVLANDGDPNPGDPVHPVLVTGPTHGTLALFGDGSFRYDPAPGYFGPDAFTYQDQDAGGLMSNVATVNLAVNATNLPPTANDDSYSVLGNSTTLIPAPGVLGNDASPEGLPLAAELVTNAGHGAVNLNPDGSFSYVPSANYLGTDSFTYRDRDANGLGSNVATVTFNVGVNNVAPVAADDTFSTVEDKTLSVVAPGVLANDADANAGDTLTAFLIDNPAHGVLSLRGDGSFDYTPDPGFFGADSFTYRVSDGQLNGATDATVTINVGPVDDAPVATNDSYAGTEDTDLVVGPPGVLANDTDIDTPLASLSAILVNGPQHGTLVGGLNPDGSFTYRPDPNYNGPDSFTYRVNDIVLTSNLATVDLTIAAVNDPPAAVNDAYQGTEDTVLAVAAPGVLQNDTDVDGDTLSAVVVNGPTHGTLALNTDGSVTYMPFANFNGVDTFTYSVSDGHTLGNTATVTLTIAAVNDPPVATDDAYTTAEDATLAVLTPGVLANDTDIDGDTLTATLVNGPQHAQSFTLNPDGSFTYVPVADYNGPDSFTYRASDGNLANGTSNLATVRLTITPVNDPPIAVDDAYTTNEDTPLAGSQLGVVTNDLDVDGDALFATIMTGPLHGSIQLNANGSFVYTPVANYNGPDNFTYRVSDGKAFSNVATVSLTVLPVPDAPTANPDAYTTTEDSTLAVAAPGLRVNDLNPDNGPLTLIVVNQPQHGTVTVADDGSFLYTPAANYFGSDSFTYYLRQPGATGLSSDTTTVGLIVVPVNDVPVAVDDAYTTNEDVPLVASNLGVVQNDIDLDGDPLSATIVTGPLHGSVALNSNGSFVYTPVADYNGPDTFTYRVSDGKAFSNVATVSLTILPVPDAPTANPDAYTTTEDTPLALAAPGLRINDLNPDDGPLTLIVVNQPQHGTVTVADDGSFTYTPAANYFGTDFFTYYLQQPGATGLHSNAATVSLAILSVNDVPVANTDTYSTAEDTTLTVPAPGVLQDDTDADDGDVLSAVLVTGPIHGTLALNSNGSFTYRAFPDYNGPDSFTYRASDGKALSNLATVNLAVTPVPDAPVATDDTYRTPEDTPLAVAPTGILANDFDVDGNAPAAILVNGPIHGTLSAIAGGGFTYTPDPNFNGIDAFTYRDRDPVSGLFSNVATVTINVQSVNDAPTVIDEAYQTNEGITLEVAAPGVLFGADDLDNDPLSAFIVNGPAHGAVSLQSNGAFLYQPVQFYNGPDSFTFRAFDGKTFSNVGTVTLNILPVANPPSAQNDSYTTEEDLRLVVPAPASLLANDFDIDGRPLTPIVVSATLNGTLAVSPDGTFTYTPNPGFSGVDSFTYRASDGLNQSNLATVTITVTPLPEATVQIDPASDTGQSIADRITNDNTPTYTGTTTPNLRVLLYAQGPSDAAPRIVGVTRADAAGNYAVSSVPLADGLYSVFTQTVRDDGLVTGQVDAGNVTIDTVGPRVIGVILNPRTGQIYVTYQDDRVGMAQASALNPANYVFLRKTIPGQNTVISATRGLPASGSPSSETVILRVRGGQAVRHGRYLFRILSGGVTDRAGNALDGEFVGSFPSGNSVPGGDFKGEFLNGGTFRRTTVAFPDFVPVVTKAVPGGPATRAKAAKKAK